MQHAFGGGIAEEALASTRSQRAKLRCNYIDKRLTQGHALVYAKVSATMLSQAGLQKGP